MSRKLSAILPVLLYILLPACSKPVHAQADPAVAKLITQLNHNDLDVRHEARKELRKIGAPAVGFLTEALKHKELRVRGQAAEVLGAIRDPRAIDGLILALKDKSAYVRQKAVEALTNIDVHDPRIVGPLIGSIGDKDTNVRISAILALEKAGDPRAVAPLVRALNDEDVSIYARTALGSMKSSEAVLPLIERLNDKSDIAREQVAETLGIIGDPRAVSPLIRLLNDKDAYARVKAVEALWRIGAPATEPLIIALNHQDTSVRWGAAWALELIGGKRATDAVAGFLITLGVDPQIVAKQYKEMLAKGQPGTEYRLILALEECGSLEMAEDFLNCRNTLLSGAAALWGTQRGYRTISIGKTSGPTWGKR